MNRPASSGVSSVGPLRTLSGRVSLADQRGLLATEIALAGSAAGRVLRPIRPNVSADVPRTPCRPCEAQGSAARNHRELDRRRSCCMAAVDRAAVDEQAHDPVAADVPHGDRLEGLPCTGCHVLMSASYVELIRLRSRLCPLPGIHCSMASLLGPARKQGNPLPLLLPL
jgi:hypothetical protein